MSGPALIVLAAGRARRFGGVKPLAPIGPNHEPIVDDYLRDLRDAVAEVRANPALAKSGSAPMYGMAAKMPVRYFVKAQVRKVIAGLYGGPS